MLTVIPLLALCGYVLSSSPAHAEEIWHPKPGISWQWKLSSPGVNTSLGVDAYDIDGFDNRAAIVKRIHASGGKAICYISAGSWEKWRPDARRFPDDVKGKRLDGWPGERWLDISRRDVLRPIMANRMDMCREKGFDAIEPDNIDGWANDFYSGGNATGFNLTYSDQIRYNRMLANMAHRRGLAIALKNDTDQVVDLERDFDFAVVEECFTYHECSYYSYFVEANKPVLAAEYDTTDKATKCAKAGDLRFSLIFKHLELDRWRRAC